MRVGTTLSCFVVIWLVLCCPLGADEAAIRHTVESLSQVSSRVAGYPGSQRAADFVEAQFEKIGLVEIQREAFPVVVPVEQGGTLSLVDTGEHFALWGLWPNLVRTPTVPEGGIRAPMVYGGQGAFAEFNGSPIDGRIVLMEFNSGQRWLHPAALGGRAVVFIEPERATAQQAQEKAVSIPLDMPRYWLERQAGHRLRQRLAQGEVEVVLEGRMDWEQRTGWNIWGLVPGTDPALSADTIAVQAYYDGTSVVPALAPSAETTAGIAALLEIARHLQANPPRRTILFLATSAHFQARQGMVDFLCRHVRRASPYADRLEDPLDIDLFISLDLSSRTDQVAVWNNSSNFELRRLYAAIGRLFAGEGEILNSISPIKGSDWSTLVPGGLALDSQLAHEAGLVSLAFATTGDSRFEVDTPLDRPERVDVGNIYRQTETLKRSFDRAFNDAHLLDDKDDLKERLEDKLSDLALKASTFPRRSQVPDKPVKGALFAVQVARGGTKGVRPLRYFLADERGEAIAPALSTEGGSYPVTAFGLERSSGRIIYAPDFAKRAEDHHGKAVAGGFLASSIQWQDNKKTLVLFSAVGQPFYGLIDPQFLSQLTGVKVLDQRGAEPRSFSYMIGSGAVGVLFGRAEDRLRIMMQGSGSGYRLLLLNNEGSANQNQARGIGFSLEQDRLVPTTLQAAQDMWALNEARMITMRAHAIENQRLERLHQRSKELVAAAEAAAAANRWDEYVAKARAALGVEARAYPEVVATFNDVIKGLIFFLALVIPAAFFGERLLFAAADIGRQLVGFGLLMLLVWLALSFVHPAFAIAHPLVILLGFSIMAMALFVLFMVTSRFNIFMKQYQNRLSQLHDKDISRLGASYAAFMLGISNMRRRKLRTGLTLLTLTLLTFTLLSFSSFERSIRFIAFPKDYSGSYEGALIRHQSWNKLTPATLEYARSHFGDLGLLAPRNWYVSENPREPARVVVEAERSSIRALGLLGVTPEEGQISGLAKALKGGTFFTRDDEFSCLLVDKMATALEIGPDEVGRARVQVFGRDLLVRGILDGAMLDQLVDLDGESLLPADFQLSTAQASGLQQKKNLADEDEDEARPFIHLPAANVLVVPYEILRQAGGSLRSVAIRFDEGAEGQIVIEDFLLRVATTLYAGLARSGGSVIDVYGYSSMGLTAVEGLGPLVVPALIAALIVFNAMLGAVYERFREIYIYSSVGLAPLHIALLFVAESCVYAVLGATLGYLLGQGGGKVLSALGLLGGIELNYSSIAAIFSVLIVMGVVLVSTVYPARLAAQAAVPDTVRRWHPPSPEGDHWRFEFPFRVSQAEVLGLCGFLHAYFLAYGEASAGKFHTGDTQLQRRGDIYTVKCQMGLAPYDLGVGQEVELEFVPSEPQGICAIMVNLRRTSGEPLYWQRLNRRFLNQFRQQMLIWHTLDQRARLDHQEQAEALLAGQAARQELNVLMLEDEAETADGSFGGFTWKGVGVGALLALFVGVAAPYMVLMLNGAWWGLNSSTPGAVFLFFVMVCFVNVVLGLVRRRLALGRGDLIMVYAMAMMALSVPTLSFVGYLIPFISGIYYHASPENNWAEIFWPHIPQWLVPQDPKAIEYFYQGLPPGESIPWEAWVEPLFWWYVFFIFLSVMMICMSAILHRQWSVHERLNYPMAQLPLAMVEGGVGGRLGPFFRQKWMWIGFAVPFVVLSSTALSNYIPAFPATHFGWGSLSFGHTSMPMMFSFVWVGLFYLVNLDITFSIWLFYFLGKVQEEIFRGVGIASTEQLSLYSYSQPTDLTHQQMGACLVFVLYGLWIGRRHLKQVWRKAWSGEGIDDRAEMLPYRAAVCGFFGSLLFVAMWLWCSGIPLVVLPLFLLVCLVFFVFVTRVVATAGVATARSPMVAAFVVISGVGTSLLGTKGLVALTFTWVWQSEMRLFPMVASSNALKLAEAVSGPKRKLFWGMLLAVVCSMAGATWIIFEVSYGEGGINLNPFFYESLGPRTFRDMARPITDPTEANLRGWLFTGIGGAIEGFLMYAQHRFYWWPLHPLGFVIGIGWLTGHIWFSAFLAWGVKACILKYGGSGLYERGKPFFLGMMLGATTVNGVWAVVDWYFGKGHQLGLM